MRRSPTSGPATKPTLRVLLVSLHLSRRWTTDPSFDGLVSAFLQRLFVRVRALQPRLIEFPSPELLRTDEEVDRRAALAVTAIALSEMSSYFLTGEA